MLGKKIKVEQTIQTEQTVQTIPCANLSAAPIHFMKLFGVSPAFENIVFVTFENFSN